MLTKIIFLINCFIFIVNIDKLFKNEYELKIINYENYLEIKKNNGDSDLVYCFYFINRYIKNYEKLIDEFYKFNKMYENSNKIAIYLVNMHKADNIRNKEHSDIPKLIFEYKNSHFIYWYKIDKDLIYNEINNILNNKNIKDLNNDKKLDKSAFKRRFFLIINKDIDRNLLMSLQFISYEKLDIYFQDIEFMQNKKLYINKDEFLIYSDIKNKKINIFKFNNKNNIYLKELISYNLHDEVTEFSYDLPSFSMDHDYMLLLYKNNDLNSLEQFKNSSKLWKKTVNFYINTNKYKELLHFNLDKFKTPNIWFLKLKNRVLYSYLYDENNKYKFLSGNDILTAYKKFKSNNLKRMIKSEINVPNYNDKIIHLAGNYIEEFLNKSFDKLIYFYESSNKKYLGNFQNLTEKIIKKHSKDINFDLKFAIFNVDKNDYFYFWNIGKNVFPCVHLYNSYTKYPIIIKKNSLNDQEIIKMLKDNYRKSKIEEL